MNMKPQQPGTAHIKSPALLRLHPLFQYLFLFLRPQMPQVFYFHLDLRCPVYTLHRLAVSIDMKRRAQHLVPFHHFRHRPPQYLGIQRRPQMETVNVVIQRCLLTVFIVEQHPHLQAA